MTPWITIVGWTLLHFLWQGALIAAIASLALFALRTGAPQPRYLIASAALALMLIAPIITATWLTSVISAGAYDDPKPVTPVVVAESIVKSAPRILTPPTLTTLRTGERINGDRIFAVIVAGWLLGVALLLLRLTGGWWAVRRLHRAALAAAPLIWQATTDRLARRLSLRRPVHVIDAAAVEVPSVIGWWRPVVLLPITAFAGLTPTQAEAILLHELAHIRRHDYLVNLLQHVTETLLFYHPAVWWMSARMRIEREHCCDAIVVTASGDALDYASALAQLEATRQAHPVLAVAADGGSLVGRIRRILAPAPVPRHLLVHPAVTTIIVALVLCTAVGAGYRWSLRTVHASGRLAQTASPTAEVIATVNGEPITQADLVTFPLLNRERAVPLSRVLVDLVDQRLVVQRGTRLGFVVSEDALNDALTYVKRQNHLQTDAELQPILTSQHLSLADLRQQLSRSIISNDVRSTEGFDRVVVTDEEARTYFDAHLDEFPLQTFDVVKTDLIARLKRETLGDGVGPESYLQALRARATIEWHRPNLAQAYAEGLAQRRAAQNPQTPPSTPSAENWLLYTTTHFDIFFTAGLKAQVGRVEQEAERAYQRVGADLKHELDAQHSLILFATSVAARAAAGPTIPNTPGTLLRTLLPLDQPDEQFRATVTHEITHAFEIDILPPAVLHATPTWMVEGLSEYEAGLWADGDQALLRDLVRTNAVPPLTTLSTDAPTSQTRLPYSLGHAAFDFIASRWGTDGIRRLLLALRNGNVDRRILYTAVWSVSADEVDRAFNAYLRTQFPASAADAPPGLPKCLQDGGLVSVDFKDVTIPQVLTFLARPCGVDVRVDGIPEREASRVVPRVQFNQTKLSEMFQLILTSAGWRYTVVDDKTVMLTRS